MDIRDKTVMVLGAHGEVGLAICRELPLQGPKELIITSLREGEVKSAFEELAGETPQVCAIKQFHGNLFICRDMKDINISDLPKAPELLRTVVDHPFNARSSWARETLSPGF